jgi:hypothetical protein
VRALVAGARAGKTAQPGAGEEAKDEVILHTSAAEAVHGMLDGLTARIKTVPETLLF